MTGTTTTTNKTTSIPSVDEIYRLTAVPEERVLFRNVDWSFYDHLVDSIPESSNIHVDYDGKDLEVMAKGKRHERFNWLLGRFVDIVTEELDIVCEPSGETTWKRVKVSRGLEADQCYYFLAEKLEADAAASGRGSDDIADYPDPDLAIEVDLSRPRVDRAGIYAELGVAEVWRFDGRDIVIERLTDAKTYAAVETSQFLPVSATEIKRWIVEEDSRNKASWMRRLRAEIQRKRGS